MPIRHPSWPDLCKPKRTCLAGRCLAVGTECSESDTNHTEMDTTSDLHQAPLEIGLLPSPCHPPLQSPPPLVPLCSELGTGPLPFACNSFRAKLPGMEPSEVYCRLFNIRPQRSAAKNNEHFCFISACALHFYFQL
jgi:hypothetical protein